MQGVRRDAYYEYATDEQRRRWPPQQARLAVERRGENRRPLLGAGGALELDLRNQR